MSKILLIPEFGSFGGTRAYFERLIKFYRSRGLGVVVALSAQQLDKDARAFLADMDCRYRRIPNRPAWFRHIWYIFPFSFLFDVLCGVTLFMRERPEAVIVSNGTPGLFLGLALLPIRMLYIAHTYPTSGMLPRFLERRKQSLLRRLFSSRKKRIVTVSRFSAQRIQEAWFGGGDVVDCITVVHNTASLPVPPIRHRRHASPAEIVVLTVGHVEHYKNPIGWIRVAKRVLLASVPQTKCRFVWAGEGGLLRECQQKISELGLEKVITFLGYRRDVSRLYGDADIYFQPSHVESHGIAVVDAMRAGIPTVVSDAGGLPESVVDGETGFVVSVMDEERMAEKLLLLGKDRQLRQKLGAAGKERYQRCFAYGKWVSAMCAIHRQIGLPIGVPEEAI